MSFNARVLLIAVSTVIAMSLSHERAYSELVPNPGFEEGDDGALANWKLSATESIPAKEGVRSSEGVLVTWSSESAGTGKHCLRMAGNGRAEGDFALVVTPRLRLLPGFKYEVSLRYRASGLVAESGDRTQYSALIMDLFCNDAKKRIGGCRILTSNNSEGWARLAETFTPPAGTQWSQVRLQLVNKYPNSKVVLWWDDLAVKPLDPTLPNPSFETGAAQPGDWAPVGSGEIAWADDIAHSGKRSVSVADASAGLFSGWATEVPVRDDRAYAFGGFVKGGDLKPDGPVGGGAFCLQFLDAEAQPVGQPVVSPPVPANADWTEVAAPKAQPPVGATTARLTAGLQFCRGTAWFDDLALSVAEVESKTAARLKRPSPKPQADLRYAANLLGNSGVEAGADGKPEGWTYLGRAEPDWTKDQFDAMYAAGYPAFNMGRGRGEWSHDVTYAGKGALLNTSVDPPLSPLQKWYGRGVVAGYWLSDPMPCRPGNGYLAGAWLRPGALVEEAWLGPLELQFFDANGRKLTPKNNPVRPGISEAPAGVWTWWATIPWVAPEGAATMRLRFGQELRANSGAWGRTYADNLAVWELPPGASVPTDVGLMTERYREWFRSAHAKVKPPYVAAPTDAAEYESCWGKSENVTAGNLFRDPKAEVPARFTVTNLLGEQRKLSLRITRTDWLGNADPPVEVPAFSANGSSDTTLTAKLPPARGYGAFHLEVEVFEGPAVVGRFSGRYAVLPPLDRPRTAENLWGVTVLVPVRADGRPFEKELGSLLKVAGFGLDWVRMEFSLEPGKLAESIAETKRVVEWYHALGLRTVLQLMPRWQRPIDRAAYEAAGKVIGSEFKGRVAAIGNWAIETANSASPFRGGGKDRLTDDEYDTILAGLYEGLKSADPSQTVLIGNIATDWEAKTVRRLYGKPAEGRFDGAILNAYMGLVMTAQNNLKEFDAHGDTQKTIWQEENADQRSPFTGDTRRYGEAEGAKNLVRSWLSLYGKVHPRVKAITMWGFVCPSEQDIMMVTPNLQPRPQFVAHAVMADALADATFVGDRSVGDVSLFEWNRGDGPILALWANAGERDLTLEVPAGKLTTMDLMGNRQSLAGRKGLLTLKLTTTPAYLFGGGAVTVSTRLEAALGHGDTQAGKPAVCLTLKNNDAAAVTGTILFQGPVATDAKQTFSLKPGETGRFTAPVRDGLDAAKRTPFRAECRTAAGALYAASASLNFAQAVRAATPPALDGTWKGWEAASAVPFGEPWQVQPPTVPGEQYDGRADVSGKLRLLWDDRCLYLGVEAADDVFLPNPERGAAGFMGDSLEFAIQPDGLLSQTAPRWEFELYLPGDGGPYAASRRFPLPQAILDHWQAAITPTGQRGNVIYQVALPWADLGIGNPTIGRAFTFALVLNDQDNRKAPLTGGRCRARWFEGVDTAKNPEGFGDVTLVR